MTTKEVFIMQTRSLEGFELLPKRRGKPIRPRVSIGKHRKINLNPPAAEKYIGEDVEYALIHAHKDSKEVALEFLPDEDEKKQAYSIQRKKNNSVTITGTVLGELFEHLDEELGYKAKVTHFQQDKTHNLLFFKIDIPQPQENKPEG